VYKMLARPTSLAQVYLAGFAAEHVATGRRPREYDVETGLAILAHTDPALVATFDGIESTDGYGAARELLRTGVRPVGQELRREVDRLYDVARESVSAVWPPRTVPRHPRSCPGHPPVKRNRARSLDHDAGRSLAQPRPSPTVASAASPC
jgi:hypothetical protein